MVCLRLLVTSFAFSLAEASEDSLHHLESHAHGQVHEVEDSDGLHLLQTSAHAKVSAHDSTTSPACKAAKDAMKAARQAKKEECPEEPVDPDEPGFHNKYKIFSPPEPSDPSTFKSCDEGWMAHTTQNYNNNCWNAAVGGNPYETVTGPLGSAKVFMEESRHLTPDMCLQLVYKISRLSGACNPNATSRRHNFPANYRFTGCTAEFWDGSGPDVLSVPEHLNEETQFNNLRGQTKFGRCMICGKGKIGDGNLVYGYDNTKVTVGKAGLARRDWDLEVTRMTCILNPEEKDQFEVYHVK